MIAAMAMALWLGILTSVSPCPLTTNVVAVSFLGRRVDRRREVLRAGLLYTLGRTLAYVLLGVVLAAGMLTTPGVSAFLQKYMNRLLGPVLIVAGMVVLDLLRLPWKGVAFTPAAQERVAARGPWGALLIGVLFALSFCPVSAGLFFAGLLPLAAAHGSRVLLPALYGAGTALPVVVFAVLLALSAEAFVRTADRLRRLAAGMQVVTGWVLVGAGVYLSLAHIFGVRMVPW